MSTRRLACLVLVLGMASVFVVGCGAAAKRNPGRDLFHKGRNLLMQGNLDAAATELASYLRQYPEGPLASRASLLLAKAYLGLGDLEKSELQFQKTIDTYPDTLEAHKSKYKLAFLAMLQNDDAKALPLFRRVAENPDGTLVPEARAMVRYLENR